MGTVEFTLDNPPEVNNLARPQGYHFATVVALQECVERDIKVRAVTVLYPNTMKETNLRGVYNLLCEMGISEWELLRFYPVGRGRIRQKTIPSSSDYKETMQFLRSFRGSTKIFFQHSLRMLEAKIICPAVREAIGILPDGQVTACAWGIDRKAQPLPEFYLGKLPEQRLSEIIQEAKTKPEFQEEASYCRILASLER